MRNCVLRQAANVLLDAAHGRVLLADLGVAAAQQKCFPGQAVQCPQAPQHFLQRFSYVGSPAWMAPEIMEQCQTGWGHIRLPGLETSPTQGSSVGLEHLALSC